MVRVYLFLTFLVTLSVATLVTASLAQKVFYKPENYEKHFEEFIKEYDRQYTGKEKELRFEIFKQALEQINKLNKEQEHATYGINDFADYTKEELTMLTGLQLSHNNGVCQNRSGSSFEDVTEDTWDWREKKAVTAVKNQKLCGSCWAFATIGNIEGQYAIRNKKLMRFSEQQLVDCDWTDLGCHGGISDRALRDTVINGGVMAEEDYSYEGIDQKCNFDKSKVKVTLSGCISFQADEEKLKSILKNTGPLAVAIDSSGLHKYKNGVDALECANTINHGVLLVGYGTENGAPYWLMKNSWSEKWGDKGYFKTKRGMNSRCMLYFDPVTAVL